LVRGVLDPLGDEWRARGQIEAAVGCGRWEIIYSAAPHTRLWGFLTHYIQ